MTAAQKRNRNRSRGTATRPLIFHPPVDLRGKYHAAGPVSDSAACGVPVILDTHPADAIHVYPGRGIPAICCQRCAR